MNSTEFIVTFVNIVRQIIVYSILFRIILSWVSMGGPQRYNKITRFINDISDPVINLARKVPHRIGMMDFAPLIAMIAVDWGAKLLIIFIQNLAQY